MLLTILNIINYTNTGQGVIGCVSLLEEHLDSVAGRKLNMKQSWDAFTIKANIILKCVNEVVHKVCKVLLWVCSYQNISLATAFKNNKQELNSKKDKEMINDDILIFSTKALEGFCCFVLFFCKLELSSQKKRVNDLLQDLWE